MSEKKLHPVENEKGLFRDSSSGAIINMDTEAYNIHKTKKQLAEQQRLKELAKENEINSLKKDVKEIKDMFKQILDKLNNGNS